MTRTNVNLTKPSGTQLYSDAVVVNGLVHTTGQMPIDDNGNLVSEDLVEQVQFVFDRLKRLLEACDSSPSKIVRLTVYLTDITSVGRLTDLRREFLGESRPASVMVEVRRFGVPGMQVEVEAVATTH
ncbi:RidA family protein [Brevibacterium sp.]|uniref:RidA family protein n=1 Tax=Brevibacterium sp. TaxID=1701 RepID=UPI0028121DE7|nr:RidA family protein [Brevibacterium sp.]